MPRARKARLSRMDAAVDAMARFGFPAVKVKKQVKDLLKVYGGDEGWPFIEEYSYKELIEALLRDVEENHGEQATEDENQPKEMHLEDKMVDGTSTSLSATQQEGQPDDTDCPKLVASSPMTNQDDLKTLSNHHLPRRRQPCYGWIESDDEDVYDFVFLEPASNFLCKKGEAGSKVKKRSRWDLSPEDP